MSRTERIIIYLVTALVGVGVFHEWRAARDQYISAVSRVSAIEQQRQSESQSLQERLDAIEKETKATRSVQAQAQKIQEYANLPVAISLPTTGRNPSDTLMGSQEKPLLPKAGDGAGASGGDLAASATIPQQDVGPLFEYIQTCRECQEKQADLMLQVKQLTQERDAYKQAAKGGSFLRRLGHDAKLLVIGGAIGAVAVCGIGHCK